MSLHKKTCFNFRNEICLKSLIFLSYFNIYFWKIINLHMIYEITLSSVKWQYNNCSFCQYLDFFVLSTKKIHFHENDVKRTNSNIYTIFEGAHGTIPNCWGILIFFGTQFKKYWIHKHKVVSYKVITFKLFILNYSYINLRQIVWMILS